MCNAFGSYQRASPLSLRLRWYCFEHVTLWWKYLRKPRKLGCQMQWTKISEFTCTPYQVQNPQFSQGKQWILRVSHCPPPFQIMARHESFLNKRQESTQSVESHGKPQQTVDTVRNTFVFPEIFVAQGNLRLPNHTNFWHLFVYSMGTLPTAGEKSLKEWCLARVLCPAGNELL